MGHTFHATPSEAIIYENSDDNPRSDPFTYRSRVVFYSGFRYPARVGQLTGTATFGQVAVQDGAPFVIQAYNCGAHGLPGIPLVEGRWLNIGINGAGVPMVGSVPINLNRAVMSAVSCTSNVVTVTTTTAHSYARGNVVFVEATANTAINGEYVIQSAPTTTSFTYNKTGANISTTADTGHALAIINPIRWGVLGADATNVYLYSMSAAPTPLYDFNNNQVRQPNPAFSISYVIDILDWTLV